MQTNIKLVAEILNKYIFPEEDKKIFWDIIYPIFEHAEFQKRMDSKEYPHHNTTSLGYHIICDAAVAYILAKRKKEKNTNLDVKLPVIISMFHDLYELPWQNQPKQKGIFEN